MSDQFDKVLDLAQKLKGPMVVYDKQGGKHLVILGIDEFAQYFDSNKKAPIESKTLVNTNSSQVPEIKAPAAINEPILGSQVGAGGGEVLDTMPHAVEESRTQVLPEELTPPEPEAPSSVDDILVEPRKPTLTPSAQVSSQQWHRLGDVMRRVRPEIASQDTPKPVPYQPHNEPVIESDEPNFLEEPIP